jgi:hypothetical protein
LSYWCSCNHEVKGSMQGIIGKRNWCLGSRWTFWCDCSYVGATGFVLCVFVCVGRGWRSRCIKDHVVSSGNLFVICYIGWFCIVFVSLPHIRCLKYFFTSSSFKRVKKKTSWCILEFFRCTHCLYMKIHTTCTNLIRTVLLFFFGKTLFSAKYPFRTRSVVNVNMQRI